MHRHDHDLAEHARLPAPRRAPDTADVGPAHVVDVLRLQRQAGNRQVVQALDDAAVQRAEGDVPEELEEEEQAPA